MTGGRTRIGVGTLAATGGIDQALGALGSTRSRRSTSTVRSGRDRARLAGRRRRSLARPAADEPATYQQRPGPAPVVRDRGARPRRRGRAHGRTRSATATGAGVVVEVENGSPAPIAVGFVVRVARGRVASTRDAARRRPAGARGLAPPGAWAAGPDSAAVAMAGDAHRGPVDRAWPDRARAPVSRAAPHDARGPSATLRGRDGEPVDVRAARRTPTRSRAAGTGSSTAGCGPSCRTPLGGRRRRGACRPPARAAVGRRCSPRSRTGASTTKRSRCGRARLARPAQARRAGRGGSVGAVRAVDAARDPARS